MEYPLSEEKLYSRLNRFYSGDITEEIPFHEYPIVGVVSTLLQLSDNEVTAGIGEQKSDVVEAYRIGGMHINVIDRIDDAIDGERGFEKTEDPESFLRTSLDILRTGEKPVDESLGDEDRVSFEAASLMNGVMSEPAAHDYADLFEKVVENELALLNDELSGREKYLTHLDSGGKCFEALAIPLNDRTDFSLDNRQEMYEIGRYFQAIDDLQDIDEDDYFEDLDEDETWDEIRAIQKDIETDIGNGVSRGIIRLFGEYMPRADKVVGFKKYV